MIPAEMTIPLFSFRIFFFSLGDFFQGGGQDAHQRAKHLLRLEEEGEGGGSLLPIFLTHYCQF